MMRIIIVVLLIVSRDYHPFRTAVDWDRATLVLHRIPFCTKSTPEIRLIVQSRNSGKCLCTSVRLAAGKLAGR